MHVPGQGHSIMMETKRTEPDINYHGAVVVFDLDDTLYKEADYRRSGFHAVADELAARYNLPASDLRMVADSAIDMKADPFETLFGFMEAMDRNVTETVQDLLPVYRNHFPEITLPAESRELLDHLRGKGVRMGLITDGRSVGQRNKIKALGIEEYFHPSDVVISEETGHDKSSADAFVRIVHHYPEASRFYYIGDNPAKDFLHPNMLGWNTVCLLDSASVNIHPQEFTEGSPSCPAQTVTSLTSLKSQL